MGQQVDDNGNPITASAQVDDEGNPIEAFKPKIPRSNTVGDPKAPLATSHVTTAEQDEYLGKVFSPWNIFSSFMLKDPGYTASGADVYTDWLDKNIPRIPGVQAVAGKFAEQIPGKGNLSNVARSGVGMVGDVLSDPRTYITPNLMKAADFGGKTVPSARDIDEFRFSTAKDVSTPKPGTSGKRITTWNTRDLVPEPKPNQIPPNTPRRFIGASGGSAEVSNPLGQRSETEFRNFPSPPRRIPANEGMAPSGTVRENAKPRFRMEEDGSVVNTETGEIIHKPDNPANEPQFMRAKKEPGNIAVGGAEPRVLDILGTTLYSKNIERVVTKELIQNSVDEMRISKNKGPVKVLFGYEKPIPGTSDKGNTVTVRDFGRGMNPDQLYSHFTNVGESGKVDEAGASGGFGFAKAAPLLGGKYAKVVSVTDKGGKRLQYTFEGSPTQLKNQDFGVPLTVKEVDKLTPTGLTVTTYFPKDVSFYDAKDHMKNVGKYSTNLATPVEYGEDYGYGNEQKWLDAVEETDKNRALIPTKSHPARNKTDKNFTANLPGADVDFHIDNSKLGVNRTYNLHVLNNGLYDSSYHWQGYGNDLESVPSEIVANITSKVQEGEPGYPFTVNREQLGQDVAKGIQDTIKTQVADKARTAMIEKVKALHDSIDFWPDTEVGDGAYKWAILDSKGLYTPEELTALRTNPTVVSLIAKIDETINQGLRLIGDKGWIDRLTGVGLVAEDGTWGVHIPDAKTNKSTILINPFYEPALPKGVIPTPMRHAASIAHTILHEMAHIEPKQLGKDPHGQEWGLRLAKIYGAMGVESDAENEIARQILNIIAPGGGEQYSPDFQELLRQYKETRGRTETKRDLLSGSSEVSYSRARGKGGDGPDAGYNGGGTPPISPRNIDQIYPKGRPRVPKSPEEADVRRLIEEEGDALRAFAIFKGMKATGDMGPMLRQGIAYAGRPAWFRALKQQFISYASEGGHQRYLVDQAQDRLMMPDARAGKYGNWIEMAGVDLSDIKKSRKGQEEATMGMDEVEKFLKIPLPGFMGGTINIARASNRSFSDSMNSLRLGVSNVLVDNFEKAYKAAIKVAKTPEDKLWAENLNPWNPAVAKIMGEDVNIGSGRAKLAVPKMNWPGGRRFSKEIDFTPAAEGINLGLFSGRLFASRLRLLNRTMNPYMYAKAATTPQGRLMMREHLKQLISLVGAAAAMSTFHEIMGGESETDPTSTNFGRSRFGHNGKITVDNTGGVGKYATLASRIATGTMKSNKGKKYRLGQNPVIGSALDRVEDFTEGLAAPHVAFIFDLLRGKEYGNKPLNFTSMNPGENTATKDLVNPMIWQDFYEIMKEDPTYIPLIFEDAVGQSVNVR